MFKRQKHTFVHNIGIPSAVRLQNAHTLLRTQPQHGCSSQFHRKTSCISSRGNLFMGARYPRVHSTARRSSACSVCKARMAARCSAIVSASLRSAAAIRVWRSESATPSEARRSRAACSEAVVGGSGSDMRLADMVVARDRGLTGRRGGSHRTGARISLHLHFAPRYC